MKEHEDISLCVLKAASESPADHILKFSELAKESGFEESKIVESYEHLRDDNLIQGTEAKRICAIHNPRVTSQGLEKLQSLKEQKDWLG